MIINNRLIDTYPKTEYLNILKNEKYQYYLNAKVNMSNTSYISNLKDMALNDAFENYIVDTIINHPQSLDRSLMSKYRDFLYQTFTHAPEIVFDSIIFSKEVVPLLFTTDQEQKITKYKNDTTQKCKEIYNKIKNKEHISSTENRLFLKFLIRQIGNENPNIKNLLDNCFSILLNRKGLNNLLAKEFILKYTGYLARRDLNLPPTEIYLANEDYNGHIYSNRNFGESYSNTSIISLNKSSIANNITFDNLPSIIKFMQTVSHETKHSSQYYRASINEISNESFSCIRDTLFSKYLSTQEYNEYKVNYAHNEIERDANEYGWYFVEKVLKKYSPTLKESIDKVVSANITTTYKESLANKVNDSKKRMPKEYFNSSEMDKIVVSHPDVLKKYPILAHLYNSNGTRKDFITMITTENNLSSSNQKGQIRDIFYDYYISDIKKGVLTNINVDTLPVPNQYDLFDKLSIIIQSEITKLKRSMDILTEQNIRSFEHINRDRVGRIQHILNYMNSKKVLINQLISLDVSSGNKRAFGFQISNIDLLLNSLKNRFKTNEDIKETDIYEDLMTLNGSDISGPHL